MSGLRARPRKAASACALIGRLGEAVRGERWNDGRGRVVRPFASLRPVCEPATPRLLETPRRTRADVKSASLSYCLLSSCLVVVSAMLSLGITGSSMRRGKTSRRGAEQDSGAAFRARVQRLIDETRRADAALSASAERSGISCSSIRRSETSRRGAEKQSRIERVSPARR